MTSYKGKYLNLVKTLEIIKDKGELKSAVVTNIIELTDDSYNQWVNV